MGATCGCYETHSQQINTEELQQRCSELNEKLESEHEQKTQLMSKIKETTRNYDALMTSQTSLNEQYEREIKKWRAKASQFEQSMQGTESTEECAQYGDEYKKVENTSNTNSENDIKAGQYKSQISELNTQICQSMEEHKQLMQQIHGLTEQIKTLQTQKQDLKTRVTVTSPVSNVVINEKIIVSKLKLQIADLQKKLAEKAGKTGDTHLHTLRVSEKWQDTMTTPGTEFGNAVLAKYQLSADDTEMAARDTHESDSSSDESSLDEQEKREIFKRKSMIHRKSKIMNDATEMKAAMLHLQTSEPSQDSDEEQLPPRMTKKNLVRQGSAMWSHTSIDKLKDEMGKELVHLMKEAIDVEDIDVDGENESSSQGNDIEPLPYIV